MRSKVNLFALHGFLGLPEDWDLLPGLADSGWNLIKENLWGHLSDFESWAEGFCTRIEKIEGERVLLGYSMGGRLAMHALLKRPELFSGAILVSANPGLKTATERSNRLLSDQVWADKFRAMPWADLLNEWNAQPVFQTTAAKSEKALHPNRQESAFDRELLAEAMELWSLGYQKDLTTRLSQLSMPILLVTGAEDTKFTALAREMTELPSTRGDRPLVVIPNAGHRVPWETPEEFGAVVANFLGRWYR